MMLSLLFACAFRTPTEVPRLVAARAPEAPVPVDGLEGRVRVVVRGGSAYDPPGREGLARLTAASLADALGASFEIGEELVRFEVPVERASDVGALLAAGPTSEAVERARASQSAWPAGATCAELAAAAWNVWAYPGHPYGHAVQGRSSVLPTLTRTEVIGFLQRRYVRESVMVGVPATGAQVGGLEQLPDRLSPYVVPAPTLDAPRGTLVVIAPEDRGCVVSGERNRELPSPRLPELLGPALRGAPLAELLAEGRTTAAYALDDAPLEQLAALRAASPSAAIVAVVPTTFGLVSVGPSEDTGIPGVQGLTTMEEMFR